jgi:hypothetical protein
MSSSNDEYRRQESLNVFITNVKFLKAPHKQALPVSATHLTGLRIVSDEEQKATCNLA